MRKIIIGLLAVGFVSTGAWMGCSRRPRGRTCGDGPATPAAPAATPAAPAAGGEAAAAGCRWRTWRSQLGPATPPAELVASTPKGELKNPYNDDIAAIAEEGHHRYLSAGCNGCHGGGGGGGMCPPLTNDTWVYGAGRRHAVPPDHARLGWADQGGVYIASSTRSWSGRCHPSVGSSRPATICGGSSPSSAR